MPLEKFLDLILSRRIYFANAAQMTDRRESTVPEKALSAKRRALEADGLAGRELDEGVSRWAQMWGGLKTSTLLSCWSIGRSESYALWKVYLGGARAGVAVRSTVSRLKRALAKSRDDSIDEVFCGTVRYTDFLDPDEIDRQAINLTKSEFYRFESELRLLVFQYPRSEDETRRRLFPTGHALSIDTDLLIEAIYPSPFAGEWFAATFTDLVRRLDPGLASRVRPSDVMDQ